MKASWELSQKNTKLLKDQNGYLYRVHRYNTDKTRLSYRCVKNDSMLCKATAQYITGSEPPLIEKIKGEHNHGAEIINSFIKKQENDVLIAAAAVGNPATERVLEEIKINIDASSVPGVAGCMRKRKALAMALHREKKRKSGSLDNGSIPTNAKEIKVILLY